MSRSTTTPALRRALAASVATTAALGMLGGLATGGAVAAKPTKTDRFPAQIALPDGFQPEGIATGRGNNAYVGSLADGDVYRVDLRTGLGDTLTEGDGTPTVGLDIRGRRLFAAGGADGDATVIDTRTGEVLASYQLNDGTTFVNDVIVTRTAAYVTDSTNAQFYVLPFGRNGSLPAPEDVRTVALGGDWEQVDGFNANGIETTPDGKALLIVNSTSGLLYRVNPSNGRATEVDLGGASLTTGDGLLRSGRTLYVVRNRMNKVEVVRLSAEGTRGTVRKSITSPDFDVPTTVAKKGGRLYLPNARFGTPPTSETAYDVNSVRARH
ncbi:hypothetical protein GCM10027020_32020 [Nocardioides salsibiostraticola]